LRQAEWVVVANESLLALAPLERAKEGLSAGPADSSFWQHSFRQPVGQRRHLLGSVRAGHAHRNPSDDFKA
jgi:hypothetical protein